MTNKDAVRIAQYCVNKKNRPFAIIKFLSHDRIEYDALPLAYVESQEYKDNPFEKDWEVISVITKKEEGK